MQLTESLTASAGDPRVAGFKSIVCYRTGLDVAPFLEDESGEQLFDAFQYLVKQYEKEKHIRLAHKYFNDYVVQLTLEIAGNYHKPGIVQANCPYTLNSPSIFVVQFHTGLGDNDIDLLRSSPSHLQPVIKAYPQTIFVLLHSSYPYTRDAGYLTAVYSNVFLDFGEVLS